MIVYCLLALTLDSHRIEIRPEGIYEPIRRGDVALADDGRLFVLDHPNVLIHIYTPDGAMQKTFGTKGDGPGQLDFPVNLFVDGQNLYVEDMAQNTIHRFDLDGAYQDRMRLPEQGLYLAKVKGGWIATTARAQRPGAPIRLLWFDEALEETVELATFENDESPAIMVRRRGDGGVPSVPYNPVRDRSALVGTPGGRFVYFYQPGGFQIQVIDGIEKKIVRTINREVQPIPFSTEYGDAKFANFEEQNERMAVRLRFEKDFPDHFPSLRNLFPVGRNDVGVRLWTGRPDEIERLLFLSSDGRDTEPPYPDAIPLRILFERDGKAYVNCFDPETEEPSIVVVSTDRVAAIAEANPYVYNTKPRLLVRTR